MQRDAVNKQLSQFNPSWKNTTQLLTPTAHTRGTREEKEV